MSGAVTAEVADEHGLTREEWAKIVALLGRPPTLEELGVFAVMWSEHCSYKSSRAFLRQLPTRGPRVLQGPGENAGAVDIGGGLAAVFKIESHNHPSFVEPFQGAATGVGGILRDVFTRSSSPSRARRRAWAASCATCSPWAPVRSRASTRSASGASSTRARPTS